MTALWERLHHDEKHRLSYPSEHVVRWVAGLGAGAGRRALDIGCGHGRHMEVFSRYWFVSTGCDVALYNQSTHFSYGAISSYGEMTALPYADESFDVALAFGVFYYGTHQDHLQAIFELYRVLKPGGKALVVTRTFRDSRAKTGEWVDVHTERMTDGDEAGMLINFMCEEDIDVSYGMFSEVGYELTETTRNRRKWRDSDWLIQVTK